MDRTVNYNSLAGDFDKRYERSDYGPLADLLRRFLKQLPSGRVLDVGCGTGHWLAEISATGAPCLGLDPARNMLEVALRKRTAADIVQASADPLPLMPRAFTHVVCINVLHHIPNPALFLAEAQRVLVPGGRIITVGLDPHTGTDQWWIYDYFPQVVAIDKRRFLSTRVIRQMLASHGFIEASTRDVLHFPDMFVARAALESGRTAKSTTSELALLTDQEYQAGMSRLLADIEAAEARGETLSIGADLRLYATTARLPG